MGKVLNYYNCDPETTKLTNKTDIIPANVPGLEWTENTVERMWFFDDYRVHFFDFAWWEHVPSGDYGHAGDVETAKQHAAIHAAILKVKEELRL